MSTFKLIQNITTTINIKFNLGGMNDQRRNLRSIEIYHEDSNHWEKAKINMLTERHSHGAISHKDKVFVFGGMRYSNRLNSVEVFENGYFTILMLPMNEARSHFGCCKVGNKVYIVGGNTGSLNGMTNSVQIYDLDENVWEEGVNLPNRASEVSVCAVENKYLF